MDVTMPECAESSALYVSVCSTSRIPFDLIIRLKYIMPCMSNIQWTAERSAATYILHYWWPTGDHIYICKLPQHWLQVCIGSRYALLHEPTPTNHNCYQHQKTIAVGSEQLQTTQLLWLRDPESACTQIFSVTPNCDMVQKAVFENLCPHFG